MSTCSRIAAQYEDGTIHGIYCHFDDYIKNGVGEKLLNHYKDPSVVKQLIDLGDISTLGTTPDHDPNDWLRDGGWGRAPDDRCLTYKDRGDDESDTRIWSSYEAFKNNRFGCFEYTYFFKDGIWYVIDRDLTVEVDWPWLEIEKELAKLK